ncbi:MAG: undecaprenyldiphospho-muramoylpentapeptide beta-N-acetylglucosaminyltransferase [Bacteroidota bacterium]|nr:undecaprenyldiphospho-muramoylpentapeptide beta-N-acetylglucosaminyltransferase [Bacteroidota bacterium]
MINSDKKYRILFAGGGTGGHLFPAIAVAEKLKELMPDSEFLFIGTNKKIEANVVPLLGFPFKPIWVKGFARKFTFDNLLFPLKLVVSTIQALIINFKFKPDIAIGSGGYVSGPAIWAAKKAGAKVVLLEQNSFPGKTTLMLEKHASLVFTSFDDSVKYFKNKNKVIVSGNPVRVSLKLINKAKAKVLLGLESNSKTILILGGSLGAKSINEAVAGIADKLVRNGYTLIWQTGKLYYDTYRDYTKPGIIVKEFIENMEVNFSAADLLVSRAGATTLAEITALGIPSILIPSPNVAANHQFYNAKSLVDENAAILIEDKNINDELFNSINSALLNEEKLNYLKNNSYRLGKREAVNVIAEKIIKLLAE